MHRLLLLSLAAFHLAPEGRSALSVEEEEAPAGGGPPPQLKPKSDEEVAAALAPKSSRKAPANPNAPVKGTDLETPPVSEVPGPPSSPPKGTAKPAPPAVETEEVEVEMPENPAVFKRQGNGPARADETPWPGEKGAFRRESSTSNEVRPDEQLVKALGPAVKQRQVRTRK